MTSDVLISENISPDAVAVAETQAELLELDDLLRRSDFVSCHAAVCQDVAAVLQGNAARNSVNFPKPKPASRQS